MPTTMLRRPRGYSLIELLMVLVMVGILATIAYPTYAAQLDKSRRADAMVALYQVQQAQERWRANHAGYADSLAALGLNLPDDGRYRVTISASSAHGYAVTATAHRPDPACTALSLELQGGHAVYGSSGTATPRLCWNR